MQPKSSFTFGKLNHLEKTKTKTSFCQEKFSNFFLLKVNWIA